jgi:hypothetical protein
MRTTLCLAVLSILLCVTVASGELDKSTGLPSVWVPETPLPGGDQPYDVLWDLTHGVYLDYQPTGRFSDLVALLTGQGFTMSTTDQGVHNVNLAAYDVLVITVLSAWNSAYTAAEVTAIEQFVAGGGGLFVMGDNPNCPNGNINPVVQAFGMTCGISLLVPSDFYFTNFAVHEIFDGINTVYYRYAGELACSLPSEPVAWGDGGEEVVGLLDYCQVIVAGDGNFCDNTYLQTVDNPAFAMNIFECLAGGGTPVEESSWGVVKALYK